MLGSEEMRQLLQDAFSPEELEIVDESEMHRGHAGYQEGGQSHFRIKMVSQNLSGLSRLQKHRAVHEALGADLISRIHALALDLKP